VSLSYFIFRKEKNYSIVYSIGISVLS